MMDIFEDPIFVIMNNDGNIIRVQVNKTYTFKKLQKRIQDDCEIPLKLQCFTCEDERNYADMDMEEGEEAANDNTLQTEDATNMVTTSDVTDVNSPVDVQINDSGCHDMGAAQEGTPCTFFVTYITIKGIDGKATAIFVKEMETIEAVMYRIQERSGLSLDHQEFTCFDKRTLEEKFWEEEYKRFVAFIKCEDDIVQSFQELDISNASGDGSDLLPTEDESAVKINKEEEIRLEVQTIHAISDTVCCADGNAIDLANPCYKFLLNDELSATKNSISSPTAISSLIPKIIECKLETLNIYKQCLSLSEYNFLTASGTIVCLTLYSCTIEDDDGNVVTLDKLFDNLQLIHTFDMHCSNNSSWFELDTVKKMVQIISRFRKLQCLGFHGLTETFDIVSFTDFVLKNSLIDIRLSFNVQLSAAYKKLIVNFMDKILRNKPKKVPCLQFPAFFEDSKFAEYDKLYRRQK